MTTSTARADASWWHALTLAERLPAPAAIADAADDAAARRLERWRAQSPFLDAAAFAAYWAACGVDRAGLAALLGEEAAEAEVVDL